MKKETLEEVALKASELGEYDRSFESTRKSYFIKGAKWQQERMYSEEDVYDIVEQAIKDNSSKQLHFFDGGYSNPIYTNLQEWFNKFKKK